MIRTQLKQKLKSKEGSSIPIALLLLIVCIVLSASVLSAAVANRVRIPDEAEKQQQSLSLESALMALEDGVGELLYYRKWAEENDSKDSCRAQHSHHLPESDASLVSELRTTRAGAFFLGTEGAPRALSQQLMKLIEEKLKRQEDEAAGLPVIGSNASFRFSLSVSDRGEDPIYILMHLDDDFSLLMDLQTLEGDQYQTQLRLLLKADYRQYPDAAEIPSWDSETKCFVSSVQYAGLSPDVCDAVYTRNELCITWDAQQYVIQRIAPDND